MAYPTGLLSFTLADIDRRAAALRLFAQQLLAECAKGDVPSSRVLDAYIILVQERAELVAAAAKPGIKEYASAEKNSKTLDAVAEFGGMVAAIDGVTAWLLENFPADKDGYLLAKRFSDGTILDRMFTRTETIGLRAQLDVLIATIE